MNSYFNRYQFFVDDEEHKIIPGVEIPLKGTDKFIQYKKGKDRLDKISQDNYNTPLFGWIILLANPSLGSIEFEIPDNSTLRIPFPLINSLQEYKKNVELYKLYYGE